MPVIPQEPHEPSAETRKLVESSSGLGLPHESIAVLVGIDDKTLRKYYRHELDMGKAKANGQIAAQIIKSNAGLDLLKEHYTLEPIALPPAKGQSEQRQLAVLTYTGQPVPTGEAYDQVVEAVEAIGERAVGEG